MTGSVERKSGNTGFSPIRRDPEKTRSSGDFDKSPDGLTYIFHLVADAKFHNGDPVDAEAVRYSFERGLRLNAGIAQGKRQGAAMRFVRHPG